MRQILAAIAITLALSGCATLAVGVKSDASPRTRVAAVGADYLVAQEGIKTYLLLPPCAATTLPTCKSPAVVAALQKGNTVVSSALDNAETLVTTPGANPDTIELAITVALDAYKSLRTTKANFGVK
jgi:uncharacterized protein YceK